MKKTDEIDMATGKPKPKPKKAQIVAGKAVKTPKTNAGIEREFRRKLQEFSAACNRSLSWWLKSKFTADNADKNLSKSLEKEFKRLSEYWVNKADELGRAYLPKMLNKIGKSADLAFLAAGVDFDIKRKTQALKNEVDAQLRENLALIQSIPRESIRRYESTLYQWASQYDRQALTEQIKSINAELDTNAQISLRRCKMIARDQTAKAINAYSRARAQSLGFEYYQWISAHDERVSTGYGGHRQLNGRYYRLDTPTAVIDSYGNVGHPSKRPNCLAKGQGVDLNNFICGAFKARSFNKFALIVTERGETLKVSREHKVLTPRGWVMAKALKKGDEIVEIRNQRLGLSEVNFKHDKIILSQIIEFFEKFIPASFRDRLTNFYTGTFSNFNADVRRDENVNIIDINGFLEYGREAIFKECVKDLALTSASVGIAREIFFSRFLAGERGVNAFLDTARGASESFICFFSDSFTLFEGRFLKSDEVSLRARARFVSELFNNTDNGGARDIEILADLQNAIAAQISLFNIVYIYAFLYGQRAWAGRSHNPALTKYTADSIHGAIQSPRDNDGTPATFVKIDDIQLIEENSSHIYSLESFNGYYTINNLINKNCRCSQACIFLMPNEKMELVRDSRAGDYYRLVKTDDED